jgi:LuxR family maltose regulon positive regulatory protein
MQPSLLTTKLFFPPARPTLVQRPRLVDRLQTGLRGPLTLLSAPAGSGKTTLLSEWRSGPGARVPATWVSLSAEDNDLTRFLQYLVAALDVLNEGLAEEIQPVLQTSETPNVEAILTLLINSMNELKLESILALDDYHLIEIPAIHDALTFLLDHLPLRLHLVILTRADPSLPLARLRTRGQLTEIRAEHLRFNEEECAQFLNQVMNLTLTGEQVLALEKRTEGWIAGLQLAALSMQGRADVDGFVSAFTGSNHYIVDYLAEEVLSRQPETVRDFLLKTSILKRLTGSLCDALTEQENGSDVLAGLDHGNLFVIPMDNDQAWYRYHHLFSDLLQSRLFHLHPKIVRDLHNRASEWFEKNGFLDEAIDHAFDAKEFERATRLFCQDSLDVIYTRSITALGNWLGNFPETFLMEDPRLCIAKAHWLHASGREADREAYIQNAQELLNKGTASGTLSADEPETRLLQGEIYSFQSSDAVNRDDLTTAVELAQKAVAIIPETNRSRAFALGNLYAANQLSGNILQSIQTCSEAISTSRRLNYPSMHTAAAYTLAQALRIQGRLHQAAQVAQEALEYVERQGQSGVFYNGFLRISLAETLYEWNALDEMESELENGIQLCSQGGMNIFCMIGICDRLLLMRANGDIAGTLQALDDIERQCRHTSSTAILANCKYYRLLLQAEQGNPRGLSAWLDQDDLTVGQRVGVNQFGALLRALQSLLLLDRGNEALPVLKKLEAYACEQNFAGWQIFILVIEAAAWKQNNNESRALDCLRRALALAEPEGYVRIFINQGEPIRDLLRAIQKQGQDSEFVKRLLAAFNPRPSKNRAAIDKPEVLSKREVELLGLIAAGCSNKEIANRLVIAVTTVKRHTTHIFYKLDVKNRTEAVSRARELGLL